MTDSPAILTEPREALRYVAEPLVASIEEMPQVVGDAFARVEAWLGARGTALSPGVLRYTTARADGSFAIEGGISSRVTSRSRPRSSRASCPRAPTPSHGIPDRTWRWVT
ncbi:hypothetical protein GCM10025873_19180 [Demequina sediminis]|uniref:hypothetical protein n=1 Tax=Demequina sediminis TaxID=1930058 RepID=UPI00257425D4|nr:hypothetical protein [Demequina sediminis]BDZ62127.1 hypothetical protein GCM10025873_19180 [Demequina sediminis]